MRTFNRQQTVCGQLPLQMFDRLELLSCAHMVHILHMSIALRFRISKWKLYGEEFIYHASKINTNRFEPVFPYVGVLFFLSKNLHRWIFRLKILHRQFHLISTVLVGKSTKIEWKWRNLHRWQKIYTAAGNGMDKFHLWNASEQKSDMEVRVSFYNNFWVG